MSAAAVRAPAPPLVAWVPLTSAEALVLCLIAVPVGRSRRRAGAWVLAAFAAMVGIFVLVYILTPFPFAWLLGTSSSRVVLGPVFFLAALVPLLLEHGSRSDRGRPRPPSGVARGS